jgi:ubiquinone/menaquinone biosynthesis C-methylase UbiE
MKIEKVYNQDIETAGRYLYTDKNNYSANLVWERQTSEIVDMIRNVSQKNISILDIGCGDATFVFDCFKILKPKMILGFDLADRAIAAARKKIPLRLKNKIKFRTLNIYDMKNVFKKRQFNLSMLRGVLHHLDNPEEAIKCTSGISDYMLVLEPNGYNLILKIIEKFSSYHVAHREKSYWPPSMEKWFKNAGYEIVSQRYIGIVPYFCNKYFAMLLKAVEPFFENIPYLNKLYCAVSLTLYKSR